VARAQEYHDFDALTRELRALAGGSDAARLQSLGTSREGRELWMMELAAPGGAPVETRPGVLVVGTLAGDHVVGSELALGVIRHLLSGEEVGTVLTDHVIYVVPRLNADGAEAMFANVRADRRRNALPFDDDNDGRIDEDPPEDLNGDGLITAMRVPDPTGDYLVHPDEPRLMKRVDRAAGESGSYAVYWEGRDSDGDGFLNEDGAGGVDLNRSFQHAYPYWERDAGYYMVSEPESRALMDFTIAHRNIAAILTFGHSDNLVTPPDARGNLAAAATLELAAFADAANDDMFDQGVFRASTPSFGGFGFFGGGGGGPRLRGAQPGRDNDPESGRRPAMTVHRNDLEYFEAVSDAYKEITGISAVGLNRTAEGAFFQYGYFQFGVPSFSTQGWGVPAPDADSADAEPQTEPGRRSGRGGGDAGAGSGTDATLLAAHEAAGRDVFVPWEAFSHPELGDVEIGGFVPYALTNPPADELDALAEQHGAFVVRLAGMLPRVRISETEVTDHGGGVFTVSVEIENTGFFPTSTQHGVVSRSVRPTVVQIQVPPDAILTGDDKTATVRKLDGSGAREEFTWVIQGRRGSAVDIRVSSQKGGSDTATVTLR
jgi:hypothetical protein